MRDIPKNFSAIIESLQSILDFKLDQECIKNTPLRLSRMYINELLAGYKESPKKILSKKFKSKSNDMVIIRNIPFVSLCSHHWLPFIGHADVAYIPQKKVVVGLSKIPRLVKCFARRFQIQENMTTEIADSLYNELKPEGCLVITRANHMCAQIRGVQSQNTEMICSAVRGAFAKDNNLKQEALELIKNGIR